MWRERIIETKKAKGITTKMMSERSASHMPVESITRILNAKTEFPRIDTVLELGASVGLSPWELFAETTSLVGDKSLFVLQTEIDALKAERDALIEEKGALIAENGVLKNKIDTLRDKVDSLKDEIIATHNYYIKQKSNN
jgi:hypothetical protein